MEEFANAVLKLNWSTMVKISEHIASEIPHLIKSESLDRDGIAEVLNDMAREILKEKSHIDKENTQ